MRRRADFDGRSTVLHERLFEGLAPGEYELRAFVRDRKADRFGSMRTTIRLADPMTSFKPQENHTPKPKPPTRR